MALWLATPLIAHATAAGQPLRIGVLAYRGGDVALRQWSPTAAYLSSRIPGYRFTIQPLNLDETRAAVEKGEVDFLLTNTGDYVGLEDAPGLTAIATLRNTYRGKSYTAFGAVIFTRADRDDIKQLSDLKGKAFMAVKKAGFGGFQMAWREFKAAGIDPFADFSQLRYSGFPQDAVAYAVREGLVDAGTLRTDSLERMEAEGKIDLKDFRILHPQPDKDFPFALSTRLYPEWPFAKLRTTPASLAHRVAIALFTMPAEHPAARSAQIAGWTTPLDYQPVHELMEELRTGPYENKGRITARAIWFRYWPWFVTAVVLLAALSLVTAYVLKLNRRLRDSEARFRTIVENAPEAIVVIDMDQRRITASNPNAEALFGLAAEEPSNKWGGTETQPDEDPPSGLAEEMIALASATERPVHEWSSTNTEGKTLPCEVRLTHLPATGRRLLRVSITDVSARKAAEEELARRRAEFEAIFNAISDAIIFTDSERRILMTNPAVTTLFGYGSGELSGRTTEILYAAKADFEQQGRMRFRTDAVPREPIYEVQYRRKDGSPFTGETLGTQVRDTHGNCIGFIGVIRDITQRKEAERTLEETKDYLQALYDASPDMIFLHDENGAVIDVNNTVLETYGYSAEEFARAPPDALMGVGFTLAMAKEKIRRAQAGENPEFEWVARRKDGAEFPVEVRLRQVRDITNEAEGKPAILAVARDISERKQAEEALYQEKERAQVTLQAIGDGVIRTDTDGIVQYLNPVARQLLAYQPETDDRQRLHDLLTIVHEETRESIGDPVPMILNNGGHASLEVHGLLVRPDGNEYAIKLTASPIHDRGGSLIGFVFVIHDITQMRIMARQLIHQASHDPLTGLFNRREFEYRLERALESAVGGGKHHALCYLDLDQFKMVNDTCGHIAGDELLRQIGILLGSRLREGDTLARLGGDEFGALLEACPLDKAEEIAESLRRTIAGFRFGWQSQLFEVGVSIGLVPITDKSSDITALLSAADSACYAAKDQGRNRVHVSRGDDTQTRAHLPRKWVQRLKKALKEDHFTLYCQHIFPVGCEDSAAHYEVLVRLVDEKGSHVTPGAFMPAAERSQLITEIDRWVIEHAFESLRRIGGAARDMRCSINLSGRSLGDARFMDFITEAVRNAPISSGQICFDVTETAAIANLGKAVRFIAKLKGMGCRFALDDFGSGLSSFAYLKHLLVDYLKVDGGFVKDMADDPIDLTMVESIVQIGHLMGLKTVAESVENDATLALLKSAGIDYAQGYALEKPRPLDEVLSELRDRDTALV